MSSFHPGFFPHVVDSTMLSLARSCPQKFFRESVQHWKRKGSNVHLHAGAAFATGLEAARTAFYVEGKSVRESENIGLDALAEAYGDFLPPEGSAKTRERMLGALDFYYSQFPLDCDHATPAKIGDRHGIEFSFSTPLPVLHPDTGEPLIYSGRADMVVEFAGGIWVEDDKTTSSLGQSWLNQWEMRGQFTSYCWAAREIGLKPRGVLVRGISILKTKYDKAEVPTYRADFEIDRWLVQTCRDLERMKACYKEGYFDYNLDESCNSYGGCTFRDMCKSKNPEPWLLQEFQQKVWDPLNRREVPIPVYLQEWEEGRLPDAEKGVE